MQGKMFPLRKGSQMLLIASEKVKDLPDHVQQYVNQYFSKKMIGDAEYYFAFLCPQYEEGEKGVAPKSTPKMISCGTVSWLMEDLSKPEKANFTLFEASWFVS